MIKRAIRRGIRRLGYDLLKLPPTRIARPAAAPPPVAATWPLPRGPHGPTDDEVRKAFARHPFWHYGYEFQGGLSFRAHHNDPGLDTDDTNRHLQRFNHFMPYLLQACGGSLKGKRVLDIACNSGFWSVQCALLGAEVVGFDARAELVEQARLLKSICGLQNAEFRVLNFWQMSPEALGGTFDVVLNLGFLYHVARHIEALELTKAMSREHILLDTAVHPSDEHAVHLKWEEASDIRMAAESGVVGVPTRAALDLMLRHLGMKTWFEVPVRTREMPIEYLRGRRTSWLVRV